MCIFFLIPEELQLDHLVKNQVFYVQIPCLTRSTFFHMFLWFFHTFFYYFQPCFRTFFFPFFFFFRRNDAPLDVSPCMSCTIPRFYRTSEKTLPSSVVLLNFHITFSYQIYQSIHQIHSGIHSEIRIHAFCFILRRI